MKLGISNEGVSRIAKSVRSMWNDPHKFLDVTYDILPDGKVEVPGNAREGIEYAVFDEEWEARDYIYENISKNISKEKNASNKKIAFGKDLKDMLNQLTDEMGHELVLYALITDMGEEEAIDKLRLIADQWNIDFVESFKTATTDEKIWEKADIIREVIGDEEFIDAILKAMSIDEAEAIINYIWQTYDMGMLEEEE